MGPGCLEKPKPYLLKKKKKKGLTLKEKKSFPHYMLTCRDLVAEESMN